MKKLGTILVALVVMAMVVAPFVQAAEDEGRGRQGLGQGMYGRGMEGSRPRRGLGADGDEGQERNGRPLQRAVGRLLIAAVTAPFAKDDAQLQDLVDKAVSDRKTLHEATGNQMKAFEVVLKKLRDGKTREELETEIAALKAAAEKQRDAAETFHEDLRAIHERMQELRPDRDEDNQGNMEGEGPRNFQGNQERRGTQERNGSQERLRRRDNQEVDDDWSNIDY